MKSLVDVNMKQAGHNMPRQVNVLHNVLRKPIPFNISGTLYNFFKHPLIDGLNLIVVNPVLQGCIHNMPRGDYMRWRIYYTEEYLKMEYYQVYFGLLLSIDGRCRWKCGNSDNSLWRPPPDIVCLMYLEVKNSRMDPTKAILQPK